MSEGRRVAVLVLGVALVLAFVAAAHPGLRFVDFVSFAGRAQRLSQGQELVNGLYPVGYPALLLLGKLIFGDVLVAGKALGVLAAAGAALAAARLVGPGPALAMAALPACLAWGSVEGTDMPAAALALTALALAERRPTLAGLAAAAACLMRYTGVAVLPAVLWLSTQRVRTLAAFLAGTAPHWALALALRMPVLPDQSQNLAIGAGAPTPLLSWATLARWPAGLGRAAWDAWGSLPGALGLAGLVAGLIRRERVAWALGVFALLDLLGVGLAFSNSRLVLPATLAAGAAVGWLLPARHRGWLALPAALLLLAQVPAARAVSDEERALNAVEATPVPGPTLSTSPGYHERRDGWLLGAASLRALGGDPRQMTPARLRELALSRGFRSLAVEAVRVRGAWPALAPLVEDPPPAGYELLLATGGWRIFSFGLQDANPPPSSPKPL